ncbi:S8 family serine peptidase [Serratia fonticola]|uniref:S8 family serine peptidase n=1 Tax=Serratia fonticola TaxID=47917 RepID=UPI0015C5AF33|nr:S8 family serine peptidase [Serratia fonticola]NXZ90053.1 S8 family serine peptidase [Serratia fonticola]NYA46148.1 S8 family serine peptidase [Serratia fonticola]
MEKKYKLLVKFKQEYISHVKDGSLYFYDKETILRDSYFIFNLDYRMAIPDLAATGKKEFTENNIDLSQYKGLVYVENDMTSSELEEISGKLRQLDIIEYVVLEPAEPVIPPSMPDLEEPCIRVLSNTPDLTSHQTYNRDQAGADVYGIDADYAWSIGITGKGVRCADIEWGNIYGHENLKSDNFIELIPTTNHSNDDHGAGVTGVIFARDNGFGMKGAAHGLDYFYGISEITHGRPAGIAKGLEHLRPGDVFLFEMQTGGQNSKYVPPDFNMAVWDLTKNATDNGIIVVMTAGNGSENLDDPFYENYRKRGDNGAIRVGAGTKVGRHRTSFSTYGSSMVHLQGWGDWTVATTGGGNLFNAGPLRNYRSNFSGTSSAGPIVASAVIAVQSWYKANHNGEVLSPHAMRDLLIKTGTRQGSGGHIGPLPNIRMAIEALQSCGDKPVRWSPNSVHYEVDDLVEHNERKYICTQAHVSNSGWAPGVANTLWKLMDRAF